MRNIPETTRTAQEWQQAILQNPQLIEAFMRECFLHPSKAYLLHDFYGDGLWGELLLTHPQLKEYCNEDLQRQQHLPDYLYSHPSEINEENLKELSGSFLEEFIMLCPEHLLECPVENLRSKQVLRLLIAHPEFASKLEFAEFLDENEWEELLIALPDFFEQCPADRIPYQLLLAKLEASPQIWKTLEKDKLSSFTWLKILERYPQYIADCNVQNLDGYGYANLILLNPDWYKPGYDQKFDVLSAHFWADTGLFAMPFLRHLRSWDLFNESQWRIAFSNLAESGLLPIADLNCLPALARLIDFRFLNLGPVSYMDSTNMFKQMITDYEHSAKEYRKIVNHCLAHQDFSRLEYLLQLNKTILLSQITSFNEFLCLCVYAPCHLLCQLLPQLKSFNPTETDDYGNTFLHYTFLRDPFGDDQKTNSIRSLLRQMGVRDRPNADGFTLAKLCGVMQKFGKISSSTRVLQVEDNEQKE